MRCLLVAALIAATATLSAQAPGGVAAGTSTIAGVVLDAGTDVPIEGADVLIFEPKRAFQLKTKTRTDGHYEFTGIAEGGYFIYASGEKYVRSCYGATDPTGLACPQLVIVPDQVIGNVDFKLKAGTRVRGTVLDENGRPREALQLTAGQQSTFGTPRLVGIFASTNEKGEFEFPNVPPGEFLLAIAVNVKVGGFTKVVPVYYPGVLNVDEATRLEAIPGVPIPHADIRLPRVEFYKVDVRPSITTNDSLSRFELSLVDTSKIPHTVRLAMVDEDFRATITGLDAGQYVLQGKGRAGDTDVASWEVVNIAQDLVEWPMLLKPTGTITGRIVEDRGGVPVFPNGKISAGFVVDGEDADPLTPPDTSITADGRFRIEGLYGTRRLRVLGVPPEYEVRSIMSGRSDIQASGIDVPSGETVDVVIIVAKR